MISGRSLRYSVKFGGSLRRKCRRTTDCGDNADGNCIGSRIGCGGCRRHACHRVQNGNQRGVMTKCGNFFRPKETKGREDSIWFPRSERPSLFSLPARESPETACESQRWIGYVNMPLTTGKKLNCGARYRSGIPPAWAQTLNVETGRGWRKDETV